MGNCLQSNVNGGRLGYALIRFAEKFPETVVDEQTPTKNYSNRCVVSLDDVVALYVPPTSFTAMDLRHTERLCF